MTTIPPSALGNHEVNAELALAIKENANLKKEIKKLNKLKADQAKQNAESLKQNNEVKQRECAE